MILNCSHLVDIDRRTGDFVCIMCDEEIGKMELLLSLSERYSVEGAITAYNYFITTQAFLRAKKEDKARLYMEAVEIRKQFMICEGVYI